MIPRLWTRELDFVEWRKLHPNLEDREAEHLFQAELKMFRNYQDEIRNQTLNRQTKLTGDILNLCADISTILIRGGVTPPPAVNETDGIHYGIFDNPVDTSNPSDIDYTIPPSNATGYIFVTETSVYNTTSSGATENDPLSKIWVYDANTTPELPPSFSFTPTEVTDFRNANEIVVVGNNMYVVYNWSFPDNDGPEPSQYNKILRLNNFSVDFIGETITYDSYETVTIDNVGSIHGITRDANNIYLNNRIKTLGGYSTEMKFITIPLNGSLTYDVANIADGGLSSGGNLIEAWGGDYTGDFTFDGIDIASSNDITNLGNYIYSHGFVFTRISGPNTLFPDSTRDLLYSIIRFSKDDIVNTAEVFYLTDPSTNIYSHTIANYDVTIARGGYVYNYWSRASAGHMIEKINIADPSDYIQNYIYDTVIASGSADKGSAHCIEFWGEDKLVVTNSYGSFVGVYNTSDLSEVGHIFIATHVDDIPAGTGVSDDLAVYNDYAYLPFEFSNNGPVGSILIALNLNDISPTGIHQLTTFDKPVYSTHTVTQII
jgi:hypothetical protein